MGFTIPDASPSFVRCFSPDPQVQDRPVEGFRSLEALDVDGCFELGGGLPRRFSIRVYGKDGGTTDAFAEFCRIKEKLDDYPILNKSDYSEREYAATLENYRSEMWAVREELPESWEAEVYSWFSDNGHDRFIESRDDQGGWAPKENITDALQDLGLLPSVVIERETR